ncbi:MAG: hypothetical protein WC517_03680 [Patescibacteria group bacterium]
MLLPEIGDYFGSQDGTELYKVTLAGQSTIWVDVLDFKNNQRFANRPYGPKKFMEEMIPISANEATSRYTKERIQICQKSWNEVWDF